MFIDHVDEVLIGYGGNPENIPHSSVHKFLTIVHLPWEGYSISKNKLAAKAKNNWILSLDSDEVPDEILIQNIVSIPFEKQSISCQFQMKRVSFFEGKMMHHGAWGNDSVIRLYNRLSTKWNKSLVHESLERNAQTKIHRVKGTLHHFTADNYQTFLEKSHRYALLSAEENSINKKKATFIKSYLSPVFSFVKEYIFQAGFIDGKRGWKIALGNAKYTFWKYKFLKEKQA
jgi:glycosyltransferase involved in cell wall biosynthesis